MHSDVVKKPATRPDSGVGRCSLLAYLPVRSRGFAPSSGLSSRSRRFFPKLSGVGLPALDGRFVIVALVVTSLAVFGCATTTTDDQPVPQQKVDRLAELHTQLGLGYLREGRYETAWKRLNRALEVEPNYAAAHNAMALLHEQLGKPEEAEAHYRRAIAASPSDSASRNNFGRFLCAHGRPAEAEAEFLKAVANPLYRSPEIAYTNAGLCLTSADPAKAEDYLRRALQINPQMPVALLRMASLSLQHGQPRVARAYLQRYLALERQTPESLWIGVQIERLLGDRDTAASYAMFLKNNFPDSNETRWLLESESNQRPSSP
ncbi:MAG: type IV pilus biogenesis/stability protein PilW [Gammaproteobacteria bacterium]